jgi:predicted SprT family Zn-dependent metalloprotease
MVVLNHLRRFYCRIGIACPRGGGTPSSRRSSSCSSFRSNAKSEISRSRIGSSPMQDLPADDPDFVRQWQRHLQRHAHTAAWNVYLRRSQTTITTAITATPATQRKGKQQQKRRSSACCADGCAAPHGNFLPDELLRLPEAASAQQSDGAEARQSGGSKSDSSSSSSSSGVVNFDHISFDMSPEPSRRNQTDAKGRMGRDLEVKDEAEEGSKHPDAQNQSIVIDLLDDDDDFRDSSGSSFPTQKSPSTNVSSLAKKSSSPGYVVSSSGSNNDYESLGSVENEWDGNEQDSSMNSDLSVKELVHRTNKLVLLSSDDEEADQPYYSSSDDSIEAVPRKPSPKSRRCPAAKISNQRTVTKSFVKAREIMSQELLTQFDQMAFGGGLVAPTDSSTANVTVTWNKSLRTTAGLTRLKRSYRIPGNPDAGIRRTALIELSTKVLDRDERLRSTLLHELCHAAAWIVDGVSKPPHGACFRKWARRAMRDVPGVQVTTTHEYAIEFKFAWACVECHTVYRRHSRSLCTETKCCGKCRGRLQEIVPGSGSARMPRIKAPPSEYNLFVKEQSKRVRKRLERRTGGTVAQGDVLKECARLWRVQKA